ncbi:SPFH domain-containing protein [Amycolatopsis sp. 195334CR]|uniref:SPFH domain-containing protein n=1 Tax=Amycolatopsis sp. 195334CR TaxID=2814588 RepID=UPI001A8DB998|nr:SPFH domain-containing protein [Amycolatopsis sp. 195334CR]MBN6038305.1 hypothetical protein [Amycolatopsis sp. 195334CR]
MDTDEHTTVPAAVVTAGWVAGAGLLVVAAGLAVFRLVPAGHCLVVRKLGHPVVVRGPGIAFLLPGLHRGVRVSLATTRLDLLWVTAVTADGVPVTVSAGAQVAVRDPEAYVLTGTDEAAAGTETVAEEEIRDHVGRRTLTELARLTGEDRVCALGPVISSRTRAWGIEVAAVEFTRAEVPLGADFLRWSARRAQDFGIVLDRQRRRLLVRGRAIELDGDEAEQIAELLHGRPVADRVAALERRFAELTGDES